MTNLLKRYLAPTLLTLLLTGCANLGAIRDFGALSADSASYTALTEDYLGSPERSKRYTLRKDDAQRTRLTEQAREREQLRVPLQLYHQAVSDYMAALATLAADEVTNYDGQINPLVDAASSNGLIPAQQADLVKAIGTLLTDAATNAYRQRELKQLITRANAPLQGILADTVRLMAAFDSAIADEKALYHAYYDELMHLAGQREPVAAELLWSQHGAIVQGFARRQQALAPYIDTLKTIAAAHQSLYDNRDKIADQEVLDQLKQYTRKIRSTYQLARTAEAGNIEGTTQ
ncbi:MAG: hypothetical protein ABW202_14310 [Duganella sp.]